jgi:GNAT superfamily N-acetyltransferase
MSLRKRRACPSHLKTRNLEIAAMKVADLALKLVPCTEPYWEFVRTLRMDERVAHGFIEKANITPEQQKKYMEIHWSAFFIALVDDVPAGYAGCVDGDVRACVHPDFQRRGVGVFLMREIMKRFPNGIARVKIDNKACQRMVAASGHVIHHLI